MGEKDRGREKEEEEEKQCYTINYGNKNEKPGTVACICSLSTLEAKAEGLL